MEAVTGRRVRIRDEPEQYTFELVQYKKDDRSKTARLQTHNAWLRSVLLQDLGRAKPLQMCSIYAWLPELLTSPEKTASLRSFHSTNSSTSLSIYCRPK